MFQKVTSELSLSHTYMLHMKRDSRKRSAHTPKSTLCTRMSDPKAGRIPVLVCSILYMWVCVPGPVEWEASNTVLCPHTSHLPPIAQTH